jgi:hypothetical protein
MLGSVGFVSGHGFSRAEKARRLWALAPAVKVERHFGCMYEIF